MTCNVQFNLFTLVCSLCISKLLLLNVATEYLHVEYVILGKLNVEINELQPHLNLVEDNGIPGTTVGLHP